MNAPTDSCDLPSWICEMYSQPTTVPPVYDFVQIMEDAKRASDQRMADDMIYFLKGGKNDPLHGWEDEEIENNHRPDLPDLPF